MARSLTLVPPAVPSPEETVRQRVRKMDKPAAMLQCNRCGGREVTPTIVGAIWTNGRPTGGTRQWLCTMCGLKGERVVVA